MEPKRIFQFKSPKCRHNRYIVDESTNTVKCGICDEKLNPIWCLKELSYKENRIRLELDNAMRLTKKLKDKLKCKCQHCNRMTKIYRSR